MASPFRWAQPSYHGALLNRKERKERQEKRILRKNNGTDFR